MPPKHELAALKETARQVRIDILKMLNRAGSGHTGGSLSAADLLTVLFKAEMRFRPGEPDWPERDRFILSKGHAAPLFYAILVQMDCLKPEDLDTLRQAGSCLQGHPDCRLTPGVECSTGSLGQGLSVGVGMALGLRLSRSPARVYVLLGDGEVQEGQVWEAAMSAAHYKLDNLCAILDNNHLQIDGRVEEVMNPEPLAEKWQAFGWAVRGIDGHDLAQIAEAFQWAAAEKGRPSMILAQTIKGKGVSIFENQVKYHGVAPTDEELAVALRELGA